MGLFSKLFHKKKVIKKEQPKSIFEIKGNPPAPHKISTDENKKGSVNIKIASQEYNYISVYDRKNRYQLTDNENIINDHDQAEKFENSLIDRIKDNADPICPNCNAKLTKWPSRKVKCKSCDKYIYVKSSFIIKDKKLPLTQTEKEKLDNYRNNFFYLKKLSKSLYNLGITREIFLNERKNMDTKFSDMDIIWSILNKLSLIEFKKLNLGIHSNIHRDMADILIKENKPHQALEEFMYVAFLDINGSMNSAQNLKDAFDSATGFVAPGIKNQILNLKENLSLDDIKLKEIFINTCKKRCKFNTPLSPEKAWSKICKFS